MITYIGEYENFVGVYHNAYTKEYCDACVDYFKHMEDAGLIVNRQEYDKSVKILKDDNSISVSDLNIRHAGNILHGFSQPFNNIFYNEYKNKYSALETCEQHNIYTIKIQRTRVSEGYHMWHFETASRCTSNRIGAFILYLNDVDEGGETEFLYYPRRIKPKQGTLVVFPGSYTHAHRGNPPLSGDKYIITGWIEF